jgi:hypothetical protein
VAFGVILVFLVYVAMENGVVTGKRRRNGLHDQVACLGPAHFLRTVILCDN